MLELEKVLKTYKIGKNNCVTVLKNIDIKFLDSKFYGIIGHSGSGKSTLINILGLLDNFDTGEYYIDKKEISKLSEDEKATLRMKKFGFVFQSFYLNDRLTAIENVMIPMIINKDIKKNERKQIAINLLKKFGLSDRLYHTPNQLSGGEKQRVAIARALANDPDTIIADEPTGNLDSKNEKIVFEYLKKLVKEENKTVIVVTHNNIINNYADEIFEINSGIIKREKEKL